MQDELESNFRSVPTMPKIVKWAVEIKFGNCLAGTHKDYETSLIIIEAEIGIWASLLIVFWHMKALPHLITSFHDTPFSSLWCESVLFFFFLIKYFYTKIIFISVKKKRVKQ